MKSFNCNCSERKKPVKQRNWSVTKYYCNYSAFNGYKLTLSDYSEVKCKNCGAIGRTKAKYVKSLRKEND